MRMFIVASSFGLQSICVVGYYVTSHYFLYPFYGLVVVGLSAAFFWKE